MEILLKRCSTVDEAIMLPDGVFDAGSTGCPMMINMSISILASYFQASFQEFEPQNKKSWLVQGRDFLCLEGESAQGFYAAEMIL